jgi:hypothetical protein
MSLLHKNINNGNFISDCFNDDEDEPPDEDRHVSTQKAIIIDISQFSNPNQTPVLQPKDFPKKIDQLLSFYHSTKKKQRNQTKFYVIDAILSATLFSIISALYWYATWAIIDDYLLPNDYLLSTIVSYIAGLILLFVNYMLQDEFQSYYDRKNGFMKSVSSNIHFYITGWAYTLQW